MLPCVSVQQTCMCCVGRMERRWGSDRLGGRRVKHFFLFREALGTYALIRGAHIRYSYFLGDYSVSSCLML